MESRPVPMDVAKVTILSRVACSNRGLSSRYAAVKAPEVMTLISAPFAALAPSSAPASKIPAALQATGIVLTVDLVFRFGMNGAIATRRVAPLYAQPGATLCGPV